VRRELNVQSAVTGRLQRRGEAVMLQVELSDLIRHAQLWGGQFEFLPEDAFRAGEELFREVALRLSPQRPAAPRKRHAPDGEAYQLYLHGRHHWNRRTREGVDRAVDYFRRAIDADRSFSLAYSGLADCYLVLGSRDLVPPADIFPKAEEAAREALQLDPESAEAHASLGAIAEVYRWDWRAAEESFARALALNENYVTARQWYALGLAHHRRFSEALAQLRLAAENDPLSVLLNSNTALVHYLQRDFAAAERYAVKALDINPYHEQAHFVRGLAAAAAGRFDDAAAELKRADEISRGEPHCIAAVGYEAARRGRSEEAGRQRSRLETLALERHVSPAQFALLDLAEGRKNDALSSLERAMAMRSGWLVYLDTEPRLDELRDEVRFRAIVARVSA
jgi:tetratricopeptide (TPR) repeat protein